jgi:diadenosine tetraphosphatase ApaH/serine/threonine PP2A family protein phosphatase
VTIHLYKKLSQRVIHLTAILQEYITLQLAESAKNADASEFIHRIRQAEYTLQAGRQKKSIAGGQINGGLLEVYDLENLVIISDLHGDSKSLFRILSEINYKQFLSKELNKLVFLGDYIDRGSDSLSIIYSVCYLISTYPDSVILMRGNHEAPAEFPFSPHDLPYEIEERFGNRWKEIYKAILSVFRLLTLATVVRQKLLLVHGGLPTKVTAAANFRESIAFAQESQVRNSVLEEILWNDPMQIEENRDEERSTRGLGRYFGSNVTRTWLQATGTKVVIRGHEPCQGFRLDHDNMIMTLFSCTNLYPNSSAAYLRLNAAKVDAIKDAKELSVHVKFLT